MQTAYLSPTEANPALLLIEPDTLGYSERAVQLQKSQFCVSRADAREIYGMRGTCQFSAVVLSDGIGFSTLRTTAQLVRAQWPTARIFILGRATSQLDDQLYDEAVLHTSSESLLLAMIKKGPNDPGNQNAYTLATWLDHVSTSPQAASRMIQESDPTKVSTPLREVEYARDWPTGVQFRHVVR